MNDVDSLLAFAKDMAAQAGTIMRHYYNASDMQVETKSDASPVTVADKEINDLLIARVGEQFPTHGVLGEEASTMTEEHEDVWVCDPIDGTVPFIIGLPTAMFSLAFVRQGVSIVAVAYDPFLNRLFTAVKGRGAYCNDRRIHVDPHELKGARVAGPSYIAGLIKDRELYDDLEARGVHVPMFPGNVYKCTLLADGRIHGRIFSGPGAHDIAAIKLLVEEAGGKVTDLHGNEQRYDRPLRGAIISNGVIHQDLVAVVKRFGADRIMRRTPS